LFAVHPIEMTDPQGAFSDSDAVARYAEGPLRNVPGFLDLHRMARLLLEEHVPQDGKVLVVGAGGGH
jgi:tRNA (cmo5U34)-methyltransferase